MTIYEGKVSFFPHKDGFYTMKPAKAGNWEAKNIQEGLDGLIKAKVSLDHWKVWLDMGDDFPRPEAPITAKQLQAYMDASTSIELVHVRRPFPQPKIKLSNANAEARKTTVNGKPIL